MSYNIICGDSKEKLKEIEDNSIDMIATDPPYGIAFMLSKWDKALPDKEIWEECLRVLKPGASAMIMSGARLDCLWRICADLENSGFELGQTSFFWMYKSGFPKGQDMSKRADKLAGKEREVVGKNPNHREISKKDYGNGHNVVNIAEDSNGDITEPSTDLAKELDGIFSKGKIKPSWEIIIWARKPTISTDYENQIAYGVGGINCGKCMVPWIDENDKGDVTRWQGTFNSIFLGNDFINNSKVGKEIGRFPANTICTDNALGNNSKYFDVDKWAEENDVKEDEDWFNALESGVIQIPKASKKEKNEGCEENKHATVKPVKLFSYLIALMVPKDNCIVLDPFCGSGTTGVAAIKNNQNFIGIDLSEEYCEIAKARCENEVKKHENIIP